VLRLNRTAVRLPCSPPVTQGGEQPLARLYTYMTTPFGGDMMVKKDGRLLARENEIRVLRALHRAGWLRTRDLAALCFLGRWASKPSGPPGLGPTLPTASAVRMAQRTMRRLRDSRLVISAQAPDGSIIYALSEGGARLLKDAGVSAVSGKDLVRDFSAAYFRHRCIANQIAISGIVQGFRVSTEREIARGLWLGGEAGIAGKRPDVLLRSGNQVWHVEVEHSRKSQRDYAALLTWLTKVLRDKMRPDGCLLLGVGLTWAKVVFICTPAFQAKLCRDLSNAGWSETHIALLLRFEVELYLFEDILFPKQ
jgi:hypothetical protein